jgi:hypothetical protein
VSSLFKFISEVAQSQTNADNTSGDARYSAATDAKIEHVAVALEVGIISGKNQTRYGMVSHFDTGSIPLGAQIDRTRFALFPSTTVSTSMTIDVSVLALNTRLDAVDVQHNNARLIYLPDLSPWPFPSASAWNSGSKTGEQDVHIALYENQRDGVKSVSQTWTANTNTNNRTVYNHWIRGGALGLNSGARVRASVYTAKGSAGNYSKGALLSEGALTDVSAWGSTVTSQMLPTANTSWYPVEGEVYVTEIELIPGLSSSGGALFIGWDSTLDGSVENETAYAASDKKLQGFGGNWSSPQWENGLAIINAAHAGTIDTVAAHVPISGYISLFSSSEYESNILTKTLTNFKANMQSALDDRISTDQWIGLRMQNVSATGGQIRSYHSLDAVSAPDTLDGKKGWVLEIFYTLPFRTVEMAGTGVSTLSIALSGSGASSLSLDGGATSSFALVGSGASKALLSGTGTSVKGLPL